MFLSSGSDAKMGDTEDKLVSTVARFLGKQMES
jgi:hypothetical protein